TTTPATHTITTSPTTPTPRRRNTRARLRTWSAAAIATGTLTGVVGMGALGLASPRTSTYNKALNNATTIAQTLPAAAQQVRIAPDTHSARNHFTAAATDLASRIPHLAASAPTTDTPTYQTVAHKLATYIATVNAGTSTTDTDTAFTNDVTTPLVAMSDNTTPLLATSLYTLTALTALGTLIGASITLARTTKRLISLPILTGAVLLSTCTGITATNLLGTGTLPTFAAGALTLTGSVLAGILTARGINKRAQEYR
ncbi:hypothetical protein GZ195_02500, partial [Dermatophilus congolensis]